MFLAAYLFLALSQEGVRTTYHPDVSAGRCPDVLTGYHPDVTK
jgi:hypothetical protein